MESTRRLLAALVLGTATTAAIADVVIVNLASGVRYFYGQLASAATMDHPDAFMQCQLDRGTLTCSANDGAGSRTATCSTTDPDIKRLFPMMDKSSQMQVFYDSAGNCTKVALFNSGRYLKLSHPPGTINIQIPTSINMAQRSARGSTSAAPISIGAFTNEGIQCSARSDRDVQCSATDSNGTTVRCESPGLDSPLQSIADQVLAVSAINEYSLVSFTWDGGGVVPLCTSVTVVNASYYGP